MGLLDTLKKILFGQPATPMAKSYDAPLKASASDNRGLHAKSKSGGASMKFSDKDIAAVKMCAESFVRVINESLQIANKSKNLDTRDSRLQVTKDRLAELKKMTVVYPFLTITSLEAFEESIRKVEAETEVMRAQSALTPPRKRRPRKSSASQ